MASSMIRFASSARFLLTATGLDLCKILIPGYKFAK
jgi:hypothetical protein